VIKRIPGPRASFAAAARCENDSTIMICLHAGEQIENRSRILDERRASMEGQSFSNSRRVAATLRTASSST
jgi:hypothetical protein